MAVEYLVNVGEVMLSNIDASITTYTLLRFLQVSALKDDQSDVAGRFADLADTVLLLLIESLDIPEEETDRMFEAEARRMLQQSSKEN